MKYKKLKELEEEFLFRYPEGFEDSKFFSTKNSKPEKLETFAKEVLAKERFSNPNLVVEDFFKVIQKSPMVSLFDKLKLKDMKNLLNPYEKDMFSIEIYEFLYGNKKESFDSLVEFLTQYKLAKWTIISVVPYTMNRQKEYFIKPTTTKKILKYFELANLDYTPKPNFDFYNNYTKILDELKAKTNKSLTFDNVAFTNFLRISIDICGEEE